MLTAAEPLVKAPKPRCIGGALLEGMSSSPTRKTFH